MMTRWWVLAPLIVVLVSSAGALVPPTPTTAPGLDDETTLGTSVASHPDPIDPGLHRLLTTVTPAAELEVMVHFASGEAGPTEAAWLAAHGLAPLRSTHVVPFWLCVGPAATIAALADHPEIAWVEWNSPLKAHMNLTKDVIKAQAVWDRTVLNADGAPDDQAQNRHITGAGVTVVVVDSGIDATHPDLDYTPQSPLAPSRPDPDDKVIYNAKLDQGAGGATPGVAWIPLQNSDTTSGHGTHVAGTVAGNGDASAGSVVGVAPDAWLIGLSMGEAPFTFDEYSALEHAYDLSEPGSATQNMWNIRVVTNSWGPGFPFDSLDPNDATTQVIERLAYDNGVAVIFANGNDGGDGDEGDDRSNIFAKVPAAIGVAAAERNGIGMASFSSRGDATIRDTWPDVSAPGVNIWSAAARASMIGGLDGATGPGELDYYYLAISGTSMATPHVAGVVALLFQAAPSLRMSDVAEDVDTDGDVTVHDPNGIAPPATVQRWIHESELILKLTSNYIEEGDNLARNASVGLDGKPLDYAQGYGLIDAEAAVALALTLETMRDPDGDGDLEHDEVSVLDAYAALSGATINGRETVTADRWRSEWSGDFVQFADANPPTGEHAHRIWIPAGTTQVTLELEQGTSSIWDPTLANLQLAVDIDGDGAADRSGTEIVESIDGGTAEGRWWTVGITGVAIGGSPWGGPSTGGVEAPYTVRAQLMLRPGDYALSIEEARGWNPIEAGVGTADVSIERGWFAHADFREQEAAATGLGGAFAWFQANWWLPMLVAIVVFVVIVWRQDPVQQWLEDRRAPPLEDDDILDAEVLDAELV